MIKRSRKGRQKGQLTLKPCVGAWEKTAGKKAADTLREAHTSSACCLQWHQRMLFALAIASERFFWVNSNEAFAFKAYLCSCLPAATNKVLSLTHFHMHNPAPSALQPIFALPEAHSLLNPQS